MMMSSTTEMLAQSDVAQNERSGASNHAYQLGRHSTSTLSMRHKKHMKRQASAHHNSNFHAGYVPVTEEVLQKTGIRGRKRYFLYCTLAFLLFVAVINTLVTSWLLYILSMTQEGAAGFEIIKLASGSMIHFFSPAVFSTILMKAAPVGGRFDESLNLVSQGSPLHLKSYSEAFASPSITLSKENLTIQTDLLRFRSDPNKEWMPLNMEAIASNIGILNFDATKLITGKLQSRQGVDDIYLESPMKDVLINATAGVTMTSMKDTDISARDIVIDADSSVIIQSKHSVYIDPTMQKVMTSGARSTITANKLCICGNGRLFLAPISSWSRSKTPCNIGKSLARKICR